MPARIYGGQLYRTDWAGPAAARCPPTHQAGIIQTFALCGRTSLDEASSLIAGPECLIGNDSGLTHVAAAVDTPVVGIYGATSPESHPPLTDRMAVCSARKLCSPCCRHSCPYGHHACMEDMKPEAVHEAFEQVLSH